LPSSNLGLKDDTLWRVLASAKHESLDEALLADFIDSIPIIGDITNAIRVKDAIDKKMPDYIVLLQAGDLILGIPPIIGEIFDILSPTNTLTYLLREK